MEKTNNEDTLIKLVNPEFDFHFMGEEYRIRKATLDKAIQYQQKIKELDGDPAADSKIIAFCIYIMLKEKNPELTEEVVMLHTPADVDGLEILTKLGFINPSKLAMAKKVQENIMNQLTSESSSQ